MGRIWIQRLAMNEHGPDTARARPLWMRIVLGLAACGFILGIYLSYRAQPDLLENLNWGVLALVAAVGIPVTVILNTLEFQASAKLVGQRFSLVQAAEITIIGSVANMLPIPGGTMVRVAALKAGGASIKRGTAATLLVSGLWIGISFIYSGLWLFWLEITAFNLGVLLLGIGLLAIATSVFLSLKLSNNWSILAHLSVLKVGLVIVDAARIFGCLLALDYAASFAQASVLAVSGVLGAAVSIVPAGLGIREGVAALLAPVVSVSVASAYLAASLNRITGLAVMTPVALYLALRRNRTKVAKT